MAFLKGFIYIFSPKSFSLELNPPRCPPLFLSAPCLSLQIAAPPPAALRTHNPGGAPFFLQTPRTRTRDRVPETSGVLSSDAGKARGPAAWSPTPSSAVGTLCAGICLSLPNCTQGAGTVPQPPFQEGREPQPVRRDPQPRPAPSGWSHSHRPPGSAGECGALAPPARSPEKRPRRRVVAAERPARHEERAPPGPLLPGRPLRAR